MRIAIDARAFSWAGIGRYTRNLISGLARAGERHEYVVLVGKEDVAPFEELKAGLPAGRLEVEVVDGSYYSWREQIIFLQQLNRIRADLFHFTHFNAPVLFRKPYVVTIHDITRFIFPGQKRQNLMQQIAYEVAFARAVKKAKAVICVSDATRQELERLPISLPKAIRTIHEGVEDSFFDPVLTSQREKARLLIGTRNPYLLYVGVWMSHKNMHRLVEAFRGVHARRQDLNLVLTGKPKPGYIDVTRIARKMGVEDHVIFAGFVPQHLLPALYAEASCFVFPSLYEGFGLPALEAAACGTPVVASSVSGIPEVMGDAAEYVNPEYVPGIVAAVNRVLTDNVRRQELITSGISRARQFRWEKAIEQHLDVYQSVRHELLRKGQSAKRKVQSNN